MKYNQYAYVEENPSKQIEELLNINFLPKNYQSWSFSDLLAKLIETIIVEAKTDEAKKAKLAEFAVSKDETLQDFLDKKRTEIGTNQFYNVCLHLKKFENI